MSVSYYEELLGTDLEDDITDKYNFKEGKLKAEITEYELPESKKKRYSAIFEYQGVYYQLIGTIEKTDFEEITFSFLKNDRFCKFGCLYI